MAIRVKWDETQQHVMCWEFVGQWSLEDLITAGQYTGQLLREAASQPVDFMIDVSQGGLIPPRLIPYVRKTRFARHPHEGLKIIVGADQYLRIFFKEFLRYAPEHWDIRFADTYEEARAMIIAQHPSLSRS